MTKKLFAFAIAVAFMGYSDVAQAQTNKNKKSRYYQNSTAEEEFNVQGYVIEREKKEVEDKPEKEEYDVKVRKGERDGKYQDEKRVIVKENAVEVSLDEEDQKVRKPRRNRTEGDGYYTTYGGYRRYNEDRNTYDKYYTPGTPARAPQVTEAAPPPPPPPPPAPRKVKTKAPSDREIKMTSNEVEYKTTVVKRRYTNLDVLCDDLDLAKIQRPVFKGICNECSRDVDNIIVNKTLSSLEKNYRLKQCYMQRDKRLRETLDDDQYRKFLRIKDADEYLILTKDSELKDGINK